MGHFTINLPGNSFGEVRWGKVSKFALPFGWLFKKEQDEKTGYIIKVSTATGNKSEYKLFKAKDGTWYQDPDGVQQINDATAMAIKEAIEQHDSRSV